MTRSLILCCNAVSFCWPNALVFSCTFSATDFLAAVVVVVDGLVDTLRPKASAAGAGAAGAGAATGAAATAVGLVGLVTAGVACDVLDDEEDAPDDDEDVLDDDEGDAKASTRRSCNTFFNPLVGRPRCLSWARSLATVNLNGSIVEQ